MGTGNSCFFFPPSGPDPRGSSSNINILSDSSEDFVLINSPRRYPSQLNTSNQHQNNLSDIDSQSIIPAHDLLISIQSNTSTSPSSGSSRFRLNNSYQPLEHGTARISDLVISKITIPRFSFMYDKDCPFITEKECCICLTDYTCQITMHMLPCNHVFHYNCLRTWYNIKQNCPMCRDDDPRQQ